MLIFRLKGSHLRRLVWETKVILSLVALFLAIPPTAEMSQETGVYIISVLILALSPPSAVALPQLGQSSDSCRMIIEEKVILVWHWHYYRFNFAAYSFVSNVFFLLRVLHCNVA